MSKRKRKQVEHCTICMEDLKKPQESDVCTLPCGHVFHSLCIFKWTMFGKKQCPVCRSADVVCQHGNGRIEDHSKTLVCSIIHEQQTIIKRLEKKLQESSDEILASNMQMRMLMYML